MIYRLLRKTSFLAHKSAGTVTSNDPLHSLAMSISPLQMKVQHVRKTSLWSIECVQFCMPNMCILDDTNCIFTHAQHKFMLSTKIKVAETRPKPRIWTVTRKHASHEALFKGSFCTVMAQMFTPLAFNVTPIQPTKFHTWQ